MVINSDENLLSKKHDTKKILIVLLIGGFLSMLNETAINITFPQIMLQYNVSAGTVQWLTTIYVYISGIVFLMSAYLIQRFSTRKLFSSAMIFLILGSLVVSISTNFTILFVGRVIQAIGTGILVPLIFNTVLILIPREKRGLVMGLVTLVVMSAPVLAPVIMGFIMGVMDWHGFFIMSIFLFMIAAIIGISFIKNVTETRHSKLDILSIILAAVGFGGIINGLSSMGDYGLSPLVTISLLVGIISLILFGIRQLTMEHPLIDLHAFKYPSFSIGMIINMVNVMVIFAIVILMPMYLQTALGTTALVASLVMLPGSILNCLLPVLAGRIYDSHGPRIIISSGLALMCISMIVLSQISVSTSLMIILIISSVLYVGSAMIMSPTQTNALGNLEAKYYASGSAIMTSLQQIGCSMGSAVFVSLMTFGQTSYLQNIANPDSAQKIAAMVSGVDFSFTVGAVLLGAAFVLSLFLKREFKVETSSPMLKSGQDNHKNSENLTEEI